MVAIAAVSPNIINGLYIVAFALFILSPSLVYARGWTSLRPCQVEMCLE